MVTRSDVASYGTDGRAVPGLATTFPAVAMVAPLSGRDLQRLPEGLRAMELRNFFSTVALRTGAAPDVVSIGGEDWQAEHVEDWGGLGAYWRTVVRRVGP